jgi:putative DNA primase/helicase
MTAHAHPQYTVDNIRHAAAAVIADEQTKFATPFTDDELLELVRSGESGDAKVFILLNIERFCFDHAAGQWFRFTGHYWQADELNDVLAECDQLVDLYMDLLKKWVWRKMAAIKSGDKEAVKGAQKIEEAITKKIGHLRRRRHREDVLILAVAGQKSLGISGREWDRDPYLLPFKNGILDLRTQQFRPGRTDDYIQTVCPIDWRGFDAPATRWNKFLLEIFDGDVERVAYLRRLLGYGIAGLTVEHRLPILWGPEGRNGKGTLLEVLGSVLGPLASPVQGELLLEQWRPRSSAAPSPDIMALRGKRLVWASETDEGRKLNAGRVKWLVGGDTLVGRSPFGKREVTFQPTHTLLMLTNFRPQVDPTDAALWERIHLIEFNISFVDKPTGDNQKPRDKHLSVKLKEEAAGIVAWLVQGYCEWQDMGLLPPPQVTSATQKYRKAEDLIGQFFDECCVIKADAFCRGGKIFETYQGWCDERGVKSRRKKFYEKLTNQFISEKTESGKIYMGIGLLVPGDG